MRFERIFEDLEGQFAHHEQQEMRAVSEDLVRAERSQLTLCDRIRGCHGAVLTVRLGGGAVVHGELVDSAPQWVLLREGVGSARVLVPLHRIAVVEGLHGRARPKAVSPVGEVSLLGMMRRIARDRATVRLDTDAGEFTGRISAVGADAIDLQALPTGEVTSASRAGRVAVALNALAALRIM